MSGFEVDLNVLRTAAWKWREMSAELSTGASRLAKAPTDGFNPVLASKAESFAQTWSELATVEVRRADDFETNLQDAVHSYLVLDEKTDAGFKTWLLAMGDVA